LVVVDNDLTAFLSRFGMLRRDPAMHVVKIEHEAEYLAMSLVHATNHKSPAMNLRWANEILKQVELTPSFDKDTGRLILHPRDLFGFMAMEIAFARESGAVTTECEHCEKVYLTGPNTGRRSHSKFCSDRCRVAAMRKRNANKREGGHVS
jgi:hypothetical protein